MATQLVQRVLDAPGNGHPRVSKFCLQVERMEKFATFTQGCSFEATFWFLHFSVGSVFLMLEFWFSFLKSEKKRSRIRNTGKSEKWFFLIWVLRYQSDYQQNFLKLLKFAKIFHNLSTNETFRTIVQWKTI